MAKNPNKKKVQRYLSDEDIDKAFLDPKWLNQVVDAATLAVEKTIDLGYDPKDIYDKVIDYNLIRKMRQLVLNTTSPIPKEIDWHGLTVNEAYLELEELIIQANLEKRDINKNLNYKINVITGKSGILKQSFPTWCATLQIRYPDLKIKQELNCKNTGCYILSIK